MHDETIIIGFPGCSARDANLYAERLAEAIKDTDPGVAVDRRRDHGETQDFGATLAIILGSASASAVAAGISKWMARNSGAQLSISTPYGRVLASNLDSKDASRIAEALAKAR